MKFCKGDIVQLTEAYLNEFASRARIDTVGTCGFGIVLSYAREHGQFIYHVHWFPSNKVFFDHEKRLALISRIPRHCTFSHFNNPIIATTA